MNTSTLRRLLFVLPLALAACAGPRGGVDSSTHTTDSAYVGSWKSASETVIAISSGRDQSFRIWVTDPHESTERAGYLLDIDGKQVAEISVYDPAADNAHSKESLPVYHYALVSVSGNTMTHAPLRPEWLKSAVQGKSGAVYGSTSQIIGGSGSVVVKDAAMMKALLVKAVHDKDAFGPTDTLQRRLPAD